MRKFYDIEQNTDEWFSLKAGHISGSRIKHIMANNPKAFGEPAKKLARILANEILTGNYVSEGLSNSNLDRGHEEEPIARELYSSTTFNDISNGGFFSNGLTGCSPDGLVGDDGVIEIKSALPHIQIERLQRFKDDPKAYDPAYKWQLIFNLKETGRDWIDFISYCSTTVESKKLFVNRYFAKDMKAEFKLINERIKKYQSLIDDAKSVLEE